jgi:hypothetical protein
LLKSRLRRPAGRIFKTMLPAWQPKLLSFGSQNKRLVYQMVDKPFLRVEKGVN